jgi:phasin family protein
MSQNPERTPLNEQFPIVAPIHFVNAAIQNFSPFGRSNLEAGISAFTAVAKTALAWQKEAAEFAFTHLDRNVEFTRRVLEAREPRELLRTQAEYLRTIADDYVHGTQRLVDRSVEASKEVLEPVGKRAEQVAEETARKAEKNVGR